MMGSVQILSLALVYRWACPSGYTHHIEWTLVYEIILLKSNFVSRRFLSSKFYTETGMVI